MRKITDAGTYTHNGASVPIAFRGKSDQHNAHRKTPVGKYVDVGQGSGTEDLYAIMAKYNIKGFEFGNWVTQEERAEYVSSITPTLEDLFSVLGSRNIGINRNVGVAFGARGSRGARAHYEPVYNMINLTRYNGAGSLAHEYGHALDYNLGSFLDQNKDYPALSGGRSVSATLPDNTGGQLRAYVNQIIDSIRNGKNFAKMELANKEAAAQGADPVYSPYWFRRTEIFARFFEQYVCYCLYERKISSRLLVKRWTYYMSYPVYVEKEDFMKIKPVADKLMKEFAAFLNSKKGHRLRATAYPKPVIVKPKEKQEIKPLKPKAPAEVKKAATFKKKISAYEKKHGKLTPKPGGRAARISKRTQQATESHTHQTETGKKKESKVTKPAKTPTIKLRKFYEVRGTLFSGYNAGTEVDIILSEVLFSDYFYIEKILGSNKERSYYGISATGKVFGSNSGCTKSDVEKKIRYGKSVLQHCNKRGEWDLEVVPKRSWYGPEYFRTLDDADRYAKKIEKLCGYKTKRTEFLITQSHVYEVMDKFTERTLK